MLMETLCKAVTICALLHVPSKCGCDLPVLPVAEESSSHRMHSSPDGTLSSRPR